MKGNRHQGMSEHILDSKGRLTLPSLHREKLVKDGLVVLSIGFRNALAIWHPDVWDSRTEKGAERPAEERPNYASRLLANATRFPAECDAQGRVRISVELREWCRLQGRDVTVVGNGDHVLVWDTARWKDFFSRELMRMETSDGPPGP